MTQRIKVVVRPKPLPKDQLKTNANIDYPNNTISLIKSTDKNNNTLPRDNTIRSFAFTKIFQPNVSQEEVYEECGFSIVEKVLEGYNGTIFAYGQTGSGKTYTIMGSKEYMERKNNPKKELIASTPELLAKQQEIAGYMNTLKGIIPRTFNQIIAVTKSQTTKKHLITCSFIQIYNENVHDLLGDDIKANLSIKESQSKGLVIQKLKSYIVKSVEELQKLLKMGYRNRSVRQTTMNKESSRSHCIFSIKIEEQSTDQHGNARFRVGKLNLVDLAGSERQKKTEAKNQGIREATKINLSLSALGKVINCLSNHRPNQKTYIPYRDSKLTRILQDSLGGNTKTVMIATISTNYANYEQTLSSLIYASRAKFIHNSPVLNEDPKDVLLREYMDEIKKLKIKLEEKEIENLNLKEKEIVIVEKDKKVVTVEKEQNAVINEKEDKPTKEDKPLLELPPISVSVNRQLEYKYQQSNQPQSVDVVEPEQSNQFLNYSVQQQLNRSLIEQKAIKKKLQNLQDLVKKQDIKKDELRQLQKIEQLKKKIKIQQQRQIELERQKRQRQEELLSIQKNYKTLNEEVDTLRQKFKDLKDRYISKCEQLQDYQVQYNEDKLQYHQIIKQKDRQIKRLQKMLQTVLQQQTYKQVVDQDEQSGYSDHESNYQTKKMFNNVKIQKQPKIKFNQMNLYKDASEKSTPKKKKKKYENQFLAQRKDRLSVDRPPASRPYESQYEKKIKKVESTRSNYTSLTNLKADKERQGRQRIKKVDSMISLKPKKGAAKLPFITQVNKLNSSRRMQQPSNSYVSKMGIDLGKIKNQILSEFRVGKSKYY